MCVAGADLPPTIFNENTGELNVRDIKVEDRVRDRGNRGFQSNCTTEYGEYGYETYCYEQYYGNDYDYDQAYGYWPDSISQFDQAYVGRVSGSKPTGGACMPVRDTPKIDVGAYRNDPSLAFAYYLNAGDRPSVEGADSPNVYNRSNAYMAKTFFIEGTLGCPDLIDYVRNTPGTPGYTPSLPANAPLIFAGGTGVLPDEATIIPRADLMRLKADFCYSYYLLGRAITPWFHLERPGLSTDDTLSFFDPDRSYLNSCQPFTRGASTWAINPEEDLPGPDPAEPPAGSQPGQREIAWSSWRGDPYNPNNQNRNNPMYIPGAREIQWAAWQNRRDTSLMEKQSGLAPVYRYPGRPDMDQSEYLLSEQLRIAWDDLFTRVGDTYQSYPYYAVKEKYPVNGNLTPVRDAFPNPFLRNRFSLPCVENVNSPLPPVTNYPSIIFNETPPPQNWNSCYPESPPDSPPNDCTVSFPQMPRDVNGDSYPASPYYCPNVEKILNPSHPFSPREQISSAPFPTDRDYSRLTSRPVDYKVPSENICNDKILGYTDYNADNQAGTTIPVVQRYQDMNRYRDAVPTVQCGIVPVDILTFRERAFQSCIMQRINYNYNVFIYLIALGENPRPTSYDRFGRRFEGTFNPPCKTRYWETDAGYDPQPGEPDPDRRSICPVRMSIQQCCRIITKDVVPANLLKIRTCEGLAEGRRNSQYIQNLLGGTPGNNQGNNLTDKRTHLTNTKEYDEPLLWLKSFNIDIFAPNQIAKAKWITMRLHQAENTCEKEPPEYLFKTYFPEHINQELDNPDPNSVMDCNDGSMFSAPECMHNKKMGSHLPYMRWWDTGTSAGNAVHGGSPINTLGTFDTIVGVGREERDAGAADKTRRVYGMLNAPGDVRSRVANPQESQVSRVGGWSELKAHQMWTTRRNNLSCIGRYEKMFKIGGPENFVLAKAGAGYTSRVGEQWPWPLGWRGYVTSTLRDEAFPRFGYNPQPTLITGLDNALPGDIIVYHPDGYDEPGGIRNTSTVLPQIYYVTDIGGYATGANDQPLPETTEVRFNRVTGRFHTFSQTGSGTTFLTAVHPTRVFVRSWDQGKLPSATGMGVSWGMGMERTIYKSSVPENYRLDVVRERLSSAFLDGQPNCLDSDYSACVLPGRANDWNRVKIYRPSSNVRMCPEVTGVSIPRPFDLNITYNWFQDWVVNSDGDYKLVVPEQAIGEKIIYQPRTQLIPTNFWSWCVNSGYDPPSHYATEYKGAMTGALTDTTLCAPIPRGQSVPGTAISASGCSAIPEEIHYYFPSSNIR